MADKVKLDIEVDGVESVDGAIKSVKDLKETIKKLQEQADVLDLNSEEYRQTIEEISVLNKKLKDVSQTYAEAEKANEDLAKAEKETLKETQDLRKQFEVLEDELFLLAGQGKQNTEQFKKLTIEAASLNKKIDEVNQSLGGNETERATQGFEKLTSGLKQMDFKTVKEGLNSMRTALAATGVMLIVQAVSYLVANFDDLSQGSGLLAKSLRFIGSIITEITDKINWFTDKIRLTNTALDKQGEAIKENAEKATEALAIQTAEYDSQIAIAKASGKSAVDLEIAKQQAIIETNKALVEQTIAYVRQGGVLTDEQNKLLTGQLEAIKGAVNQQDVIQLTAEKTRNDNAKKASEERLANLKKEAEDLKQFEENRYKDYKERIDKELEDLNKQLEAEKNAKAIAREEELNNEQFLQEAKNKQKLTEAELKLAQNQTDIESQIALLETKRQIELQDLSLTNDERALINQKYRTQEEELNKQASEKTKALKQKEVTDSLNIASSLTNSLTGLSNLYFDSKRKNLKKGSAEELEAAKKQFNINKALSITGAVIDTAKGIVSSLAQSPLAVGPIPSPMGIASLAAVSLAGAVNIAKIASTKFDAGASSGTSATAPSIPIPSPPVINTPSANTNQSTTFGEDGKNLNPKNEVTPVINVKATVGVDEITNKQNRVDVLEKQSTF
jgi:hypothetical protein